MAFYSETFDAPIIDEFSSQQLARFTQQNEGMGGYVARDFSEVPFGSVCQPFSGDLIPESEWAERIEEMERKKATLRHLQMHLKIPILNQKSVPYCWCYGATKGIMYAYAIAGYKVPHLSATSLAAKVTNYVKRGWWAAAAIEGSKRFGISTLDYWPDAEVDRRYDTAEQRENASLHKAVEYLELPSNSFSHLMTDLLRGFPVTLGLTWWGHLVLGVRPVVLKNGNFGIDFDNSWGLDWGNQGTGILTREKAIAFEQFSVRSAKLGGSKVDEYESLAT